MLYYNKKFVQDLAAQDCQKILMEDQKPSIALEVVEDLSRQVKAQYLSRRQQQQEQELASLRACQAEMPKEEPLSFLNN